MSSPQVPDHTLLHPIGRGAYGEVWLARHHTFGTLRAVKVVRRADFEDERPFRREFEGIRRYEPISRGHPHLIPILHVGGDDTAFFYVMELADPASAGRSQEPEAAGSNGIPDSNSCLPDPASYSPRNLRTDLKSRGHGTADEAIALGRSLAGALGHLHSHGLVHRDVKPSNVIWVHGQPKLADLGLVTDAGDSRSFVGTEGYIPPEGPGSGSADCYALGKLLYEFATGRDRHDWPAPAPDLASRPDRQHLLELNAILHRACAPRPADRYPDGTAMQADLERLAAGGSVRRRQRLGRLGRLATAAAIVVTGLLLLAWLLAPRLKPETVSSPKAAPSVPTVAVLPFDDDDAAMGDDFGPRLTEEIRAGLIRVPRLRVIGPASSEAFKASPDRIAMARSNQVSAVLEGRLRRTDKRIQVSLQVTETHGGSLLWAEVFTNSVSDPSSVALAVLQGLPDKLGIQITDAQRALLVTPPTLNLDAHRLFWEARALIRVGTEQAFDTAIQKLTLATQLDTHFALAHAEIAGCYLSMAESDYRSPTNYWLPTKIAAERAYELAPGSVDANLAMAGLKEVFDYDWLAAESFYRRAVALNPNHAAAHWIYGLFLAKAGRVAEARNLRERALVLDPFEAMNPMNLGHQLFEDEGRPAAALPYYEQAYALRPHPEMRRNFGEVYLALGRDTAALQAYEEYLLGSGVRAGAAKELRDVHAHSGWTGYWQKWLALMTENPGKYHRWHDRAQIYDRLKQTNEVIACLRKSIENREFYATGIRNPNAWKPYRSHPDFPELLRMLRVDETSAPRLE